MRRPVIKSQGQIINNFFSLITIIIMAAVITLYSKYVVKKPSPPQKVHSGLLCQDEVYTTDKLFNKELMPEAFTLLQSGHYTFNGGFILSEVMPTKIQNTLSLENVNKAFLDTIIIKQIANSEKFLNIKYEIIENDKDDVKKREELSKVNTGSLLTSFRLNGKEVYRMYTDFNTSSIDALSNRVKCTMEAFKYNAK